jgi:hypothetical protein
VIPAFLAFNALLYAVFAVWCTLAPSRTSAFLGLSTTNAGGASEYLAVYGGLQAGLAVFYALAAALPAHRRTAVLFSLALYGGIVAFRSIAVVRSGFGALGNARYAYVLELVLLVVSAVLVIRDSR